MQQLESLCPTRTTALDLDFPIYNSVIKGWFPTLEQFFILFDVNVSVCCYVLSKGGRRVSDRQPKWTYGKMTPDNEQALKRERRRSKNQPVFTALVTTWDYLTAVNRLNSSDGASLHQLE